MYNKLCDHTFQLFFAEQFFKLFDKDRSGTISLSELIDGLNMLMEGTDMDKLKFLFDVYDVDGKTIFFFHSLQILFDFYSLFCLDLTMFVVVSFKKQSCFEYFISSRFLNSGVMYFAYYVGFRKQFEQPFEPIRK